MTTDTEIARMSRRDRIGVLLQATLPKVPGDVAVQIRQLLTPQALHVIEAVVALWGLSHFFGFGEVFDTLVLATGIIALGADAVHAAKLAMEAFMGASKAQTQAAIDEAAGKLAEAIGVIGVDMLAALLFRWKRPNLPHPAEIADFPRAPEIATGSWRYTPMVKRYPFPKSYGRLSNAYGFATPYGDIHINTRFPLDEQQITLFHEQFHTLLRPKLDILRRLRAKWTAGSYKNSYLTRFLEEALCESSAQMRAKGFNFGRVVEGLRFPLNGQYDVTLTRVAQEVGELFLGPIKVDNDLFYGALTEKGAPMPMNRHAGLQFGNTLEARPTTVMGRR